MVIAYIPRGIKRSIVVVALLLIAAAAWLHFSGPARSAKQPSDSSIAPREAPPVAAPSAAASPAPSIQHPVKLDEVSAGRVDESSIAGELTALFGRNAILTLFQLGDFPRRVAATVDNLGRHYAPAAVWPLNPAPGRFTVDHRNNVDVISASNGRRYGPYLRLLETVDASRAVSVYLHFYPLFQAAYEGIGYPKGYFNDRLVEVLDELLATPELTAPAVVWLADIKGPELPSRPWVLYRFDDPGLEGLSAGQKILLRFGPSEEKRIKAILTEYRRLIVAAGQAR